MQSLMKFWILIASEICVTYETLTSFNSATFANLMPSLMF